MWWNVKSEDSWAEFEQMNDLLVRYKHEVSMDKSTKAQSIEHFFLEMNSDGVMMKC